MKGESLRRLPGLALAAAAVTAVSLCAGCVPRPWVVLAVNDSSVDVVIRIEWSGGYRDAVLDAATEGSPIALDRPQPPARVTLLDAETCAILGSTDLPAEAAVVYLRDGPDGDLRIQAYAKDIRRGPVLPEEDRCGDR